MDELFTQVGIRVPEKVQAAAPKWYRGKPIISMMILGIILLSCLFCEVFIPYDPTYMDLYHACLPPGRQFWFGTDSMGRDLFSMIFYGGRISLLIGLLAAVISTLIAVVFGAVSGMAPKWLDDLLMRMTDLFLSIPSLLLIIFIQAILGKANVMSISVVIGITGWTSIAKVVRTEVRQIRNSEYVLAAKCMGAGFFRILWVHLAPNFASAIMFMVVMNVRGAMGAESTLSFMGIGLPLEIISWGSMLSLSEKALLSGYWWMIVIPGVFLVVTLLCITNIGNYMRKAGNHSLSNL